MPQTDPTRCAACGEIIVPAGEAWDHVGEPKPKHPATPRRTAPETWQAAQARLSALESALSAQRPLVEAARRLEETWERLCACVDEFSPDDGPACGEYRDMLDDAILGVLAAYRAARGGEQ